MNKTKYTNQLMVRALNKLELPSPQARYDRLEVIARLHGRDNIRGFSFWLYQLEMWETDMKMLKL